MNHRSDGIMLGRSNAAWIWSGSQRSCLALGPTRSGKTSSLIIPNVLCAPGSVVVTSTKQDVLDATHRARSEAGDCFLFDPLGSIEAPDSVQGIHWSPLRLAHTWDGALLAANAMVGAARLGRQLSDDHWSERAGALLACLLHASALEHVTMSEITAWVDRRQVAEPLAILDHHLGTHPAIDLLLGISATEARELSSIYSTASGTLGVYRSDAVRKHYDLPEIDAQQFAHSSDTLYVCASSSSQRLLAPLVVGMLSDISESVFRRSDDLPHTLFALDELANIAPLPDLPRLISEGAGQGLLVLGCLQDLSQARQRWGAIADGFLSLFSTTVVFPGVADRSTLELIAALGGEHDVLRSSITYPMGRGARGSRTDAAHPETIYQTAITARGKVDQALLLDASKNVNWISLSPAYRDEPWKSLSGSQTRDRLIPEPYSARSVNDRYDRRRDELAPTDRGR